MNEFLFGLLAFDVILLVGLVWRNATLADERDQYRDMAEHFEISAARARYDLAELTWEGSFDDD